MGGGGDLAAFYKILCFSSSSSMPMCTHITDLIVRPRSAGSSTVPATGVPHLVLGQPHAPGGNSVTMQQYLPWLSYSEHSCSYRATQAHPSRWMVPSATRDRTALHPHSRVTRHCELPAMLTSMHIC